MNCSTKTGRTNEDTVVMYKFNQNKERREKEGARRGRVHTMTEWNQLPADRVVYD